MERYWLARLTDSGADAYSLDRLTLDDDGRHRRRDDADASRRPAARAWCSSSTAATCSWCARSCGRRSATGRRPRPSNCTIAGAPATLSGSAVLAPANPAAGSRLDFKATVEVNIPLVGGKIENFIGSQLVDLLIAEQRFTTVWIAENA